MNWRRRLAILLPIGLLAYALFLIAYLPAAVVWTWAADAVPARLYGIAGSIWSGRAETVMLAGTRFSEVHWELAPLALLSRTVTVRVHADLPHGGLDGQVSFTPGGGVTAEGVQLEIPVDTLFEWVRAPALTIMADGRVEARLRHLHLEEGRLASARGRITWHEATIKLGGGISLGDVVAQLQPVDEGGIRITLTNDGGVLRLAGDGKLAPNGHYHLTLHLHARSPGAPASQRAARMLGLPDLRGTVIEVNGVVGGSLPTVTVR